jgi:hypothetical protein
MAMPFKAVRQAADLRESPWRSGKVIGAAAK